MDSRRRSSIVPVHPVRLHGAGRARGSAWPYAVAAGWIVLLAAAGAGAQTRIERASIASATEVPRRRSRGRSGPRRSAR
jgi:hypothetical protein